MKARKSKYIKKCYDDVDGNYDDDDDDDDEEMLENENESNSENESSKTNIKKAIKKKKGISQSIKL